MKKSSPSHPFLQQLLLGFDALGLTLAFYGIQAVRFNSSLENPESFLLTVLGFGIINLFCLYLMNLYHLEPQTPLWLKPLHTLTAAFFAGCLIVIISYFIGVIQFSGLIGRGVLIGSEIAFAIWASLNRMLISKWLRKISRRTNWLVLGSNEILLQFIGDLSRSNLAGSFTFLSSSSGGELEQVIASGRALAKSERVVRSAYSPDSHAPAGTALSLKAGGGWGDLERLANEPWSGVIVAVGSSLSEELSEVLVNLRIRGTRIYDLVNFYEEAWYKIPVFYLERSWFAMSQGFHLLHSPFNLRAKRVFDVTFAVLLLVLTLPVLIVSALAVKIESRGPALYRQKRVGENELLFTVYKLRSMTEDAEKDGVQWAAHSDPRTTRIGGFLRKFRIDELPQLVNVIKGDMSFIGPRPERPEFTKVLESKIPFYALRHVLKPGVTGWAQVLYPYGASVDDAKEKLRYDLYYIKNYSLALDAAIVIKTIRVVLFGAGR